MISLASSNEATNKLHAAIRSGNLLQFKKAINDGANLNAKNEGGQTPVMAATLVGQTEIVKYLLTELLDKIDLTIGEKDGYTPMHGAAFQGRAEIASLLIKAGLNPSDQHSDGWTPIHRACWGRENRHTETVKVFLNEGKVDVNEISRGQTPLDSAIEHGNKATIHFLKAAGGIQRKSAKRDL